MTPEQVLLLLADYIEASRRFDGFECDEMDSGMVEADEKLYALNPALIRAQAAALAEAEVRETRLREALSKVLEVGVGYYNDENSREYGSLPCDTCEEKNDFARQALKGADHAE